MTGIDRKTRAPVTEAEHLRLAQIARDTFASETGKRVEPLRQLAQPGSLPDWLVQLRAKGHQALHDYYEGLRRRCGNRERDDHRCIANDGG